MGWLYLDPTPATPETKGMYCLKYVFERKAGHRRLPPQAGEAG